MAREFEVISNPQFHNMHVFVVHMLSRTPHIHQELEVGYVLRGWATLRIGGRIHELMEKDGYLINPLEVHEFQTGVEGATILAIQVSPKLFDAFFSETPLLRFSDCTQLRCSIQNGRAYDSLLAQCVALGQRYIARPPHYEYDCFALMADILARLIRLLPREPLTEAAWLPIRQRMERFLAILDYIDENFHRKLLLEEISRRENLTMPYLSHMFREILDMSFQEYLKKKRFEYARALILGTNRSLLDISLESGFSDTRYMIRMFESEFGCAPREYRRKADRTRRIPATVSGDSQSFLGEREALELLDEIVALDPDTL